LVETLDRVGGCLERVVRIPRRDDSAADRQATDRDDDAGAGTAYLQKRAESVAREPAPDDSQWARWRSRLDSVTCEMQVLVQPADACDWYDGLHLEVTALYPSGTYGRFAEAIREGMPQETERAAAVTGALPPYSFVGDELTPWPLQSTRGRVCSRAVRPVPGRSGVGVGDQLPR
jgi:hypothetical protein